MSRSEFTANVAMRTGVDHGRNWPHARPMPYQPRRANSLLTTITVAVAAVFCVAVLAAMIVLPAIGA